MDTPRSILLLTTQFSRDDQAADGLRQLAEAFQERGLIVHVIVMPWQSPEEREVAVIESGSLRVLRVPPLEPRIGRVPSLLFRWAFSSRVARRHAERFMAGQKVDLLMSWSPAVNMTFLTNWALRTWRPRSYLHIVDFFPFHQRALGLVPGGPIFRLAVSQETRMIRRFDVIGCMSPMNIDYLKSHYPLRPEQRAELLPLGTAIGPQPEVDRAAIRTREGLPLDKTIVLFGGQITEGRGIPEILDVAAAAAKQNAELHFLIIGRGRLTHLVEEYVRQGHGNLTFRDQMPRDAYTALAAAADIGLVVTVANVDVPTFPSKTLDYLQVGLAVVAAVEASTDYGEFVNNHGFGIAIEAGQPEALLETLLALSHDADRRQEMGRIGRRVLHEVFDVGHMADRVLSQLEAVGTSPTSTAELPRVPGSGGRL